MWSKAGISCAIGTAYLANYTLFDANIVGTAFGICNICARAACIIAPYIVELKPFSIC